MAKSQNPKPWFRSIWLWIGGAVGCVCVGFLLLMPYAIKRSFQIWTHSQSGYQVNIENVDFNPFNGHLAFHKVSLQNVPAARLSATRAFLDIDWSPLFRKDIHIRGLELDGLQTIIDENALTQWPLASFKPSPAQESSSQEENIFTWDIGLDRLEITESVISLRFQKLKTDSTIKKLKLLDIYTWDQTKKTQLNLDAAVNTNRVQMTGTITAFGPQPAFRGRVKLTDLDLAPFAGIAGPIVQNLSGRLSVDTQVTVSPLAAQDPLVAINGNIILDQTHLHANDVQWNSDKLIWTGTGKLLKTNQNHYQFQTEGHLNGNRSRLDFETNSFSIALNALDWQNRLQGTIADSGVSLRADESAFKMTGLQIQAETMQLATDEIGWEGSIAYQALQGSTEPNLDLNGSLKGASIKWADSVADLNVQGAVLDWQGRLQVRLDDMINGLAPQGNLRIDQLAVSDFIQQHARVSCEGVLVKDVQTTPANRIDIREVQVNKIEIPTSVLAKKPPVAKASGVLGKINRLAVQNLRLKPSQFLHIEAVRLFDLEGTLQRFRDGSFNVNYFASADSSNNSSGTDRTIPHNKVDATADRSASDGDFHFKLDRLMIVGDSKLLLQNEMVSPILRTTLDITEGVLKDIDTRHSDQPSYLSLAGRFGQHTKLALQGNLNLFDEPFSCDVTARIKSLDLPLSSPYTVQPIGYNFVRGEMDADIFLEIDSGKLDGHGKFFIISPEIEVADAQIREKYNVKLAMPLDTALNLLRDKDDNIELEVPVTGDISSPQFSFMSIINKAIIKATGTTAISYLKYVLGPYGLAIGATEIGYKMASGIRLEPIAFKAGSSVIEPENNAYLEKVTQILKDRKKVRITFCGWAVEQDRAVFQKYLDLSTRKGIIADDSKNAEEVEQKLLSLAEARAHALEKYLVEKHGIDHKRILICRPQIDPEIEAQPRVRLVI